MRVYDRLRNALKHSRRLCESTVAMCKVIERMRQKSSIVFWFRLTGLLSLSRCLKIRRAPHVCTFETKCYDYSIKLHFVLREGERLDFFISLHLRHSCSWKFSWIHLQRTVVLVNYTSLSCHHLAPSFYSVLSTMSSFLARFLFFHPCYILLFLWKALRGNANRPFGRMPFAILFRSFFFFHVIFFLRSSHTHTSFHTDTKCHSLFRCV